MKRNLVPVALLLLLLTGCSSTASIATKVCKEEIEKEISADKLDFKDFTVGDLGEALFELSDSGERDHSEDVYSGAGTVHSWNGSVEKKHTVICIVNMKEGEIDEVSVTVG